MRLSRAILFLLISGFVLQGLLYYQVLPETMAVHFNGLGEPDNWASKQNFFLLEGVILALLICEFTLLPFLIEKMPDSLMNLPNKDFWLAPERRAETFITLRHFFEWFSVMLLALFIAVNQLVFRANMHRENLPAAMMWTILGVFILFVIIWMFKFIGHFRRPDREIKL